MDAPHAAQAIQNEEKEQLLTNEQLEKERSDRPAEKKDLEQAFQTEEKKGRMDLKQAYLWLTPASPAEETRRP
jgi:hypothetical protein